jgi:hypothetical protein
MNTKALANLLMDALVSRRIEQGKIILLDHESLIRSISANSPDAPYLFYILSGWAEYSKVASQKAANLASAYRDQAWPQFPLPVWAQIEVGLALLALYQGRDSEVDTAWEWVQANARRFQASAELVATLDFVRARAKKKHAVYPLALDLARSAVRGYAQAGLPKMVAVAQITESWLLWQLGNVEEANKTRKRSYMYLMETEDWTAQANIWFGEARHHGRVDQEKARSLFSKAIQLYSNCTPPHRNLRRALIELANVEHRMAERQPARANELRAAAGDNIQRAEELLHDDPVDIRNRLRLLLARTNQALYAFHPSRRTALEFAQEAYSLAKAQHPEDALMMARALYQQALIQYRAAEVDNFPSQANLRSCRYATDARDLAQRLNNNRLTARIHTLLGNLYLREPFCNYDCAEREWLAAQRCLRQHQTSDYLFEEIRVLGDNLHSFQSTPATSLIISVTDELAFNQSLAETVEQVENAIILAACKWLGENTWGIARALHIGKEKVRKYINDRVPLVLKPGNVIVRITTALAFSQPLEETLRIVEREIILAARIHKNLTERAARDLFKVNYDKIHPLWQATEEDAQRALDLNRADS